MADKPILAPTARLQEPPAISSRPASRFHGRQPSAEPRPCAEPGCPLPGEFRAPRSNRLAGEAGGWLWFCLDHVRAYNARYNYFDGLTPEEIHAAQSPLAGWERLATGRGREAFHFGDSHGLFDAAPGGGAVRARRWPDAGDAKALGVLGLDDSARGADVRRTYKALVRRYHPDSNGGDRSREGKLQAVVQAYTHLRQQPRFKSES